MEEKVITIQYALWIAGFNNTGRRQEAHENPLQKSGNRSTRTRRNALFPSTAAAWNAGKRGELGASIPSDGLYNRREYFAWVELSVARI